MYCTVKGTRESVEVPLISPKPFSTTQGTLYVLAAAPRVRLTFFLHQILASMATRNVLTFVNTTAIAYRQNHEAPADFLPIYNSTGVHKRHVFASTRVHTRNLGQSNRFSTDFC